MNKVAAIIWLRFKLASHQMRTASGIANFLVGTLVFLLGAILSLALAFGFGIMIYLLERSGNPASVRMGFYIVFYTFFFFGVIAPLIFMSGTTGFQASRFLIFPISRKALYGVMLATCAGTPEHLFYYPALLTVFVTGVLIPGINILVALCLFLSLLIFFIAASNALILLLQGIMKKRRIREIIAIISFMILVAVSIVPSMIESTQFKLRIGENPYAGGLLRAAAAASSILPPSLAAEGLAALHGGRTYAALANAAWLLLWDAGGGALGYFFFIRYFLEEGGRGRKREKKIHAQEKIARKPGSLTIDDIAPSFVPVEVAAIATKDLRYYFRSVIGRFNLLMLPAFLIVVVFVFAKQVKASLMGIDSGSLVFFGMLLYLSIFSNNFIYNTFAWEGSGVKLYFISPVGLRKVIMGKNLGMWVYQSILLVLSVIMWMILMKIPDVITLINGILLFNGSMILFTIIGNFTSVMFPLGRDMSTMRNNPSSSTGLIALFSLLCNAMIIFILLVVPLAVGMRYMQPVILVIWLLILIWIYRLSLKYVVRLIEARKEGLIESLKLKA